MDFGVDECNAVRLQTQTDRQKYSTRGEVEEEGGRIWWKEKKDEAVAVIQELDCRLDTPYFRHAQTIIGAQIHLMFRINPVQPSAHRRSVLCTTTRCREAKKGVDDLGNAASRLNKVSRVARRARQQ